MLFLRFILSASTLSEAWAALKALYKAARGKIKSGKVPKGFSPPTGTWAQRFWSALMVMLMGEEVIDFFSSLLGKGFGLGFLGFASAFPDQAANAIELIAKFPVAFEGLANRLAAQTMRQITGVDVDPKQITAITTPEEGRRRAIDIGGQFGRVVTAIFNVDEAARDFVTRTGSSGSANNLASYLGTNLLFQLRSLTISSVASLTGWHTLRHLEALHQSVNWAFGFGWLSWAVMSQYMDVCIKPGLQRSLQGAVLPNDFTEAEARWAWWAGFLSKDQLDQVMNNAGVRVDIRDALLNRAEADMTESMIYDLWQHGRMPESEVRRRYRVKGFGERSTDYYVEALKDRRLWNLLDKIDNKYLQLYRDCVIGKIELQQWLGQRGWSADEQDAAIALQELDRRSRKFLTEGDLNKLADSGMMGVGELSDYLQCEGMTELDAAMKAILLLDQKLPKEAKDCQPHRDFLAEMIHLLTQLLTVPGFNFSAALAEYLRCLRKIPPIPIPPGPPPGPMATPHLPSGGISTLPSTVVKGEPYRLVWSIDRTDRVVIDNDIGEKPPQGTLFLVADENRVFHLVAKNDDGEKTFQASVLVRPKSEERQAKPPRATAHLSVSPSRAFVGDQIVIEWEAHNATAAYLDEGAGPQIVALSGARFSTADRSRIYTLTVSGPGGQDSATDAIIIREAPPDTLAQPTASLAITPGQQEVGGRAEIRWSTSNATVVTLEGIAGLETVGPVGARIVVVDHDRILTLRASNPAEGIERLSMDALIARTPASSEPPKEPPPTVALTLRPAKAQPGDTIAVEWRTTNADRIVILRRGTETVVGSVGGDTFVAQDTELILLHAYGPGGDRAIAKMLVVDRKGQ